MKRKVKRFSNGGMDDYESSDDAKNLMAAAEREAAGTSTPIKSVAAPAMKMASFGEAFKEARNRGDKTFEYMGKKYTTETAGDKKPAAATPKTSTPAATPKSTPSTEPKAGSYGSAASSQKTLGDVLRKSSDDREEYMKNVREGKTKTLGTRFREGLGSFGRALSSGRPQGKSERARMQDVDANMKKGGAVKVSSASKRADGCAVRGKTRGKMV